VYFAQPAIKRRWIVFVKVTTQSDIAGYDNLTGLPFTVTNDPAYHARPRVSGDGIVYEDYNSGNADVFGYHILTGCAPFPIATGPSNQFAPAIDGTTVVWVDCINPCAIDQIFTYDLVTQVTRQLTTGPEPQDPAARFWPPRGVGG